MAMRAIAIGAFPRNQALVRRRVQSPRGDVPLHHESVSRTSLQSDPVRPSSAVRLRASRPFKRALHSARVIGHCGRSVTGSRGAAALSFADSRKPARKNGGSHRRRVSLHDPYAKLTGRSLRDCPVCSRGRMLCIDRLLPSAQPRAPPANPR
jgi:hypothetical protein